MAPQSNILPGGPQGTGLQRVRRDLSDLTWTGVYVICKYYILQIGEQNGNPLQYPCLENPVDRGAWRATVHRVVESDTTASLTQRCCWDCGGDGRT